MALKDDFKTFCENITLSIEDMSTTVSEITKKLNDSYYDLQGDTESHMYIVGSVGRQTAVESCSDLDMIFDLPTGIYKQYNDYQGNGQSALLQNVKATLKERYPRTDIRGDGQVVVIDFNKYTVELVPGFRQNDDRFKYPDTHNGGSWKFTDPISEQEECRNSNDLSNGTFYDFCHILREWKNNVGFSFKGLLIDTLVNNHFEDNEHYTNEGYEDYFDILLELLKYLKNQDAEQSYWYALGSNQKIYNSDKGRFIVKAKSAYNKLFEAEDDEKNKVLRELLGNTFPKKDADGDNVYGITEASQKFRKFYDRDADSEEFIDEHFSVDIKYDLSIDCIVSQDGFRPYELRQFLKHGFSRLPHDRNLDFYIASTDCPKPYKIYWKVRNVGNEAKRRNQIRGNIQQGESNGHWKEHTCFKGPHYVECYLVKNRVCVAKDRINVPIE